MKPNDKDIHIGDTERIVWMEFDDPTGEVVDTDDFLLKHRDFWEFIEVFCVAGCCGLDAFSFYPDDIKNASSHLDKEKFEKEWMRLKNKLLETDKNVVASYRLNVSMHKLVFIQLIDHILRAL